VTTYANLDVHEGSVSGIVTIALIRRSREIVITNDSPNDLQFKFNQSEVYATLRPDETISMKHLTNEVLLAGNGAYRVWSRG